MNKRIQREKRAKRIRAKISGTAGCPRLSVFRSARFFYAQLIDDASGKTLADCDSRKLKIKENNVETARKVGTEIAKIALQKNLKKAVFDRSGYKYHGKVKAFAEGAREAGLMF